MCFKLSFVNFQDELQILCILHWNLYKVEGKILGVNSLIFSVLLNSLIEIFIKYRVMDFDVRALCYFYLMRL